MIVDIVIVTLFHQVNPLSITLTQDKTNQEQASMHTEKQRQKARVTGSSSTMIEVCACLSSELFQAAALSEHAPDEVSQGGERAVITRRLEGRSIRQTALRGVRHTHRTSLHVSGPGYSHRVQHRWQTAISLGPLSSSLVFSLVDSLRLRKHQKGRSTADSFT